MKRSSVARGSGMVRAMVGRGCQIKEGGKRVRMQGRSSREGLGTGNTGLEGTGYPTKTLGRGMHHLALTCPKYCSSEIDILAK